MSDDKTRIEGGGAGAAPPTDGLPTQIVPGVRDVPVAFLLVVDGPGTGSKVALYPGTNAVGREAGNLARIDFGDDTIHRREHTILHVDPRSGRVGLIDRRPANPVYVNDRKVEGDKALSYGDRIQVGSTMLRLERAATHAGGSSGTG